MTKPAAQIESLKGAPSIIPSRDRRRATSPVGAGHTK